MRNLLSPSRRHAAFGVQALNHLEIVHRVARRLTHSASDADDLTQETYARALRSSHRFQWGTNLKAWLLTILKNTDRNRRRDASRAIVQFDGQKVDRLAEVRAAGTTPEQRLLDDALAAGLRAGLESLPPALRDTLWLCDVDELSYAEIAALLRIPVGTVMSRVFRARRLLYARLSKRNTRHAN